MPVSFSCCPFDNTYSEVSLTRQTRLPTVIFDEIKVQVAVTRHRRLVVRNVSVNQAVGHPVCERGNRVLVCRAPRRPHSLAHHLPSITAAKRRPRVLTRRSAKPKRSIIA